MRAALLAIFLFSTAALAGDAAAAESRGEHASHRAVMPMTVNGVKDGEVNVIIQGDDVLVRTSDLDAVGVRGLSGTRQTIEGDTFVSLRSLAPQVEWKIDDASVQLALTVDPSLFHRSEQDLASNRPAGIVYAKNSSAFLNYAVTVADPGTATAFAEAGWSLRGSLLYSSLARNQAGKLVRGLSNLVVDDRSRLTRWTFGDAVAGLADRASGPFIAGVSVSRQYSLDPYFYSLPGVDLSGVALTPSRADVYVNGQLVRQVQVQPGPFEFRNIPVYAGGGDVQVVVRDAFGGQRTLSSSYYLTSQLLAAGLSEFSYNLGFRRENTATESFDYREFVFVGAHRRGLSSRITAGVRAEAAKGLVAAGASATANYGFGDVEIMAGVSRGAASNGWTGSLAYAYARHGMSAGVYYRRMSRSYATTSVSAAIDRLTSDLGASAGVTLGRHALSLEYGFFRDRDRGDGYHVSARLSTGLTAALRLQAVFGRARAAGMAQMSSAQVSLLCSLGQRRSAIATATSGAGRSSGSVDVVQSVPKGTGLGYRIHTDTQGSDVTGSGLVQYQGPTGLYEASYSRMGTSGAGYVSMSGGLVAIGDGVHLSRAVRDGFALIRVPDVAGVRAFASNQQVGVTNRKGEALVPDLVPYYGNQVSVSDQDLPMDYEIDGVRKLVAPPYRGGALVEFPIRRFQAFRGSVSLSLHGREVVPAYGALRLSAGGEVFDSPIGSKGEYYIENVPPGAHAIKILYKETSCDVSVTFPSSKETVVQMPRLRCAVDASVPGDALPAPTSPVAPSAGSAR
jgi:outer membrane usher protein